MATTAKGKLVEPLYGPYDDHRKAPNSLPLPRHCLVNSKNSERAIQYRGIDFNEWTTKPRGFREVGKLTQINFQREGNHEIILLNPCELSALDLNLEALGYRANIDRTTAMWTERLPFTKYSMHPTDYMKWAFEVL